MRAANEAEELEDMRAHFLRGELSGQFPQWQREKRTLLNDARERWGATQPDDPMEVLDLGVGDVSHMVGWESFDRAELLYTGLDGVAEVVQSARKRFPHYDFQRVPMSKVPDTGLRGYDLVVCYDVLYHLPSDEDHDRLVRWLFGNARARMVAISWSDQDAPGGRGIGHGGFSWFPRERPDPRRRPGLSGDDPQTDPGWEPTLSVWSSHAGPRQCAELWVRDGV